MNRPSCVMFELTKKILAKQRYQPSLEKGFPSVWSWIHQCRESGPKAWFYVNTPLTSISHYRFEFPLQLIFIVFYYYE